MCVCVSKVYELTLHYTQHWDHNVVTASLELLQQMFRTPPPELLHILITAGSVSHATVFRQDTESRARSSSILELIGKDDHICVQCNVGPIVLIVYLLTNWNANISVQVAFNSLTSTDWLCQDQTVLVNFSCFCYAGCLQPFPLLANLFPVISK